MKKGALPKKMSATMVGRRRKFLGLLCSKRPYIELFYVEQKETIHGIFFFSLSKNKKCQLTFLKKLP